MVASTAGSDATCKWRMPSEVRGLPPDQAACMHHAPPFSLNWIDALTNPPARPQALAVASELAPKMMMLGANGPGFYRGAKFFKNAEEQVIARAVEIHDHNEDATKTSFECLEGRRCRPHADTRHRVPRRDGQAGGAADELEVPHVPRLPL